MEKPKTYIEKKVIQQVLSKLDTKGRCSEAVIDDGVKMTKKGLEQSDRKQITYQKP